MMRPRIQRPFTAFPKGQRGAVIVLVVVALAAILLMGALALDGGHMLVNKTRLQNAVDAAALSGAKTLMMVSGATGAASQTQSAALATLTLNANATGNHELATANVTGFATVELSAGVYGPFSFPGPADAKYVRVSVPNYPLDGFFWGILQATGNGSPTKAVAAIATAGPSPTSPCDVAPMMVCGDPAQPPSAGNFWGYQFGELQLLKTAAGNSSPVGPGNFQLLDFGAGGNAVKEALAGGIKQCNNVGEQVQTKPGNTVGPAIQGLNTRFGQYSGGLSAQDYPSDLVISDNGTPGLEYDDSEVPPRIEYQDEPVTSSNGNLSTASGPLLDYNDWVQSSAACAAGTGSGCQSGGAFERRMLKIVVGQCSGTDGGQASVPVLGFGCFFVLQPASQHGNESQVYGQFVKECEGDNVSGPNPWLDTGPQVIQLYKTYINGVANPSTDS